MLINGSEDDTQNGHHQAANGHIPTTRIHAPEPRTVSASGRVSPVPGNRQPYPFPGMRDRLPSYNNTPPGSRPPSRSKNRKSTPLGMMDKMRLHGIALARSGPLNILRYICIRWPLIPFLVITILVLGYRPVSFWMMNKKTHGWSAKPNPTFSHVLVHAHNYWLSDKVMVAIEPYLPDRYGREFMWYYPIPELVNAKHPIEFELPRLGPPVRRKRRKLRHHPSPPPASQHFRPGEKTDLVSPAFLSFNVLTMHSPKARLFRDLLRKYQKSRIPPAFEHLVEYNFVMASPPGNNHTAWKELSDEQEEFGDLVVLDELETDESKRMPENGDFGKTYRWLQEVVKRGEDGRGRKALWYL